MADDLSLLFRIRGDAAGAKQATAETRAAVASLRSQLGSDFNAMQSAGQSALANLGNSVNVFVGQRVPLLGGAFLRVTENLKGFGDQSHKNDVQLASLNKTIDGLSTATGKSRSQITSFLTQFVQIEGQAKRDALAIEKFGAATAQSLIPQLEKAGTEMATVAANSTATGASLAGVAGPVGIAVLALAALTAGAVILSREFLNLVVSTAEWQGKMKDLSQQVGISTETLSALEILAKTTGGSIDGLTASLGIFQKKLEEAQDPESKTAELLNKLGIETDNTEESFRQAIKTLAGMEEGYHQTATALELFGRGGKQILAIIKETNGDLDGAIEKFRALGLVISEEDAKAADEFNDQLALLGFQSRALTASLVKESIPQILSALRAVSQLVKENRDAISAVGTVISVLVRGQVGPLISALQLLQTTIQGVRDTWLLVKSALAAGAVGRISIIMDIFQSFKGQQQALAALGEAQSGVQGVSPFQGIGGGFAEPGSRGGGGGRGAAAKKVSEGQQLLNQLTEEYSRLQERTNNLTKVEIVQKELLKDKYKNLSDEMRQSILEMATWITMDEQADEEQKKNIETNKEYLAIIKQIRENMNRTHAERLDLETRIAEAVQNQREALSELLGFEKTHLQIAQEYIAEVVKEAEALGGVTAKMREYFALLIQIAVQEDEAIERKKKLNEEDKKREKVLRAIAEAQERAARAGGWRPDDIKQQVDVLGTLRGAYEGLFSAIGQGIGQVVHDFVLLGTAGPNAMRKVLASALATVAAQAAAQAIYELALGFAALTPWGAAIYGPAPLHFKSAALFGSIAAVAAVAGRAVAGNSFQQSSASGGGSGGGGTSARSGGSGSSGEIPTRDVNRNALATQTISHELVFRVKGDAVVENFVQDYNLNGRTRIIIKSDGQG